MSDTPVKYPEHEKLKQVSELSQKCGEFLEWLQSKYTFGYYHEHTDRDCYRDGELLCAKDTDFLRPVVGLRTSAVLAEFFEIDEQKLEDEKVAMLYELRCMGGRGVSR